MPDEYLDGTGPMSSIASCTLLYVQPVEQTSSNLFDAAQVAVDELARATAMRAVRSQRASLGRHLLMAASYFWWGRSERMRGA